MLILKLYRNRDFIVVKVREKNLCLFFLGLKQYREVVLCFELFILIRKGRFREYIVKYNVVQSEINVVYFS